MRLIFFFLLYRYKLKLKLTLTFSFILSTKYVCVCVRIDTHASRNVYHAILQVHLLIYNSALKFTTLKMYRVELQRSSSYM